jgi:hypothetical protein
MFSITCAVPIPNFGSIWFQKVSEPSTSGW